jgi:two-component system, OmpR family, sensor kinase
VTSLGISGYLIIRTVERSEIRQIDNQLEVSQPIAIGIARNAAPPSNAFRPFPQPNGTLSDIYVAAVNDGTRSVVLAPQSAKGKEPRTPSTTASSIGSARPRTVGSVSGPGRWRAVLLQSPDGHSVLIAAYMGAVDATATELRTAVFAAGAVVAVILIAAAFWIERLGLRPIANMRRVAEAVVAGDRKRRVTPASSGAETADLAGALNSMLDQQNAIEDRLRQFVADASHELRTPTAVISGLTQLWRQGDLRDGDSLQDAMRRIGQESARMKGLVEELLLLARLDEGMPLRHDPVDLSALVRDVLEAAASSHPSRQVSAQIDDDVSLPGEEAALRRVVTNLITNALVHTPATSAVAVHLRREHGGSVLEIADTGPGMSPADAAHAFDRFWRAEASRTRTGSGLGLSIAQAIVAAHGGRIHLATSPARGTTVLVELPIPTAPVEPAHRAPAGSEVRALR